MTPIPRAIHVLPILALAALLGFFVYRLQLAHDISSPVSPSALIDHPVPAFDLPPLLPGAPGLKQADLLGRVTLVNFFASWCVPCRAEQPALLQASRAGVVLAGINFKDKPEAARAWLTQFDNPYRTVVSDVRGDAGRAFGIYGVPESYLIDRKGIIRFHVAGPLTPDILRQQILPLVDQLNR